MATQALAKNEPQLLAQIRQDPLGTILRQYDDLEKVANITFPPTALDNIPPMHKPSPSVVRVSLEPQSKDTYDVKGSKGLSKHVVLKMLSAAGASWKTQKLTPDTDLDNIRWQAQVWRRLPDGTLQVGEGSKAWSWAKCQESMDPKQAAQYREFADEQTETKALLRAARAILNIKICYTSQELAKPFVFLRIVPDFDMSDPEVKRMVMQRALDSTYALYGQPSGAPELPPPAFSATSPEPSEDEYSEDEPAAGAEGRQEEAELPVDPAYDPFREDAKPAGAPACSDCGRPIEGTTVEGRSYTDSQIVDLTMERAGKALCFHCYAQLVQQKRKAVA